MLTQKGITLTDRIKRVEGNIVSDMDGEKVMLSVKNGKYYNLGEIGGSIWELLDSTVEVNDLVQKLMEEFHVERDECETQTTHFLNHLLQEGLVELT
ncbi:SynChlorMet cassette protein ScmD [Mycobacteroides abscessus subsp. abscessus]|nr:SynChlorMet cassette protein ScmD [Mycobacteroides abscessus subsp. abscessus]